MHCPQELPPETSLALNRTKICRPQLGLCKNEHSTTIYQPQLTLRAAFNLKARHAKSFFNVLRVRLLRGLFDLREPVKSFPILSFCVVKSHERYNGWLLTREPWYATLFLLMGHVQDHMQVLHSHGFICWPFAVLLLRDMLYCSETISTVGHWSLHDLFKFVLRSASETRCSRLRTLAILGIPLSTEVQK